MKIQDVLLALGAVGAAYAGLALRAASSERSSPRSLLADPVPPALAETSGTRLKAKVTTGSDGSKIVDPEVLYDTVLETDCTFHKAMDGAWRCLPIVGPHFYGFAYEDDQCTNRLAYVSTPAPGCDQFVPPYADLGDVNPYCGVNDGDEVPRHVFEVGELVGLPAPVYGLDGQGDCVPTGSPGLGVAFAVTELAPSAFVEGTPGVDP